MASGACTIDALTKLVVLGSNGDGFCELSSYLSPSQQYLALHGNRLDTKLDRSANYIWCPLSLLRASDMAQVW